MNSDSVSFVKATVLFVGMVVGAGMFAIPYVVWEAGIIWSLIHFLIAIGLVTLVHILYGRIIIAHYERHRLPGYVRSIFGEKTYLLAITTRVISYFVYLLLYGVLGGIFLSYIIPPFSSWTLSILMFVILAPVLFMKLKNIGSFNLFLTLPLIFFVGGLSFFAFVYANNLDSIPLHPDELTWFMPIGVFLFALGGASIVPEMIDLLGKHNIKGFYKSIVAGTVIVISIYIAFTATVLRVAGDSVSADALSSLVPFVGIGIFLVGALIGLFSILTSYVAIGVELRYTLQFDAGISFFLAWLIIATVPILLFLFGLSDFVRLVSIAGAIGVGIEGAFIALLSRRILHTHGVIVASLVLFMVGAALLEISHITGIL